MKENIKKMLEKYARRGIDVAIFKAAYENLYNKRINVQELFEMGWRELLLTMKDICYINETNIVKPRKGLPGEDKPRNKSPPGAKSSSPSTTQQTTPAKPSPDVHKWLSNNESPKQSVNDEAKTKIKQALLASSKIAPLIFAYQIQKPPNDGKDFKVNIYYIFCAHFRLK